MKRLYRPLLALIVSLCVATGCKDDEEEPTVPGVSLTTVASSRVQWTGVAVAQDGRIFANFPRMETDTVPYSVALINGDVATPFPNADWNNWAPGLAPQDHFVCVQSVYIDDQNNLWVVDAASPSMRGTVRGGPKLLKFSPTTGAILQRVDLSDEMIVYPSSYLNDIRVDTQKNFAYVTDSNQGAIIVVNLATGRARRVLGRSPLTKSENLVITAEGRTFRNPSGKLPQIDADGIALTPLRPVRYTAFRRPLCRMRA